MTTATVIGNVATGAVQALDPVRRKEREARQLELEGAARLSQARLDADVPEAQATKESLELQNTVDKLELGNFAKHIAALNNNPSQEAYNRVIESLPERFKIYREALSNVELLNFHNPEHAKIINSRLTEKVLSEFGGDEEMAQQFYSFINQGNVGFRAADGRVMTLEGLIRMLGQDDLLATNPEWYDYNPEVKDKEDAKRTRGARGAQGYKPTSDDKKAGVFGAMIQWSENTTQGSRDPLPLSYTDLGRASGDQSRIVDAVSTGIKNGGGMLRAVETGAVPIIRSEIGSSAQKEYNKKVKAGTQNSTDATGALNTMNTRMRDLARQYKGDQWTGILEEFGSEVYKFLDVFGVDDINDLGTFTEKSQDVLDAVLGQMAIKEATGAQSSEQERVRILKAAGIKAGEGTAMIAAVHAFGTVLNRHLGVGASAFLASTTGPITEDILSTAVPLMHEATNSLFLASEGSVLEASSEVINEDTQKFMGQFVLRSGMRSFAKPLTNPLAVQQWLHTDALNNSQQDKVASAVLDAALSNASINERPRENGWVIQQFDAKAKEYFKDQDSIVSLHFPKEGDSYNTKVTSGQPYTRQNWDDDLKKAKVGNHRARYNVMQALEVMMRDSVVTSGTSSTEGEDKKGPYKIPQGDPERVRIFP